MSRPRVQKVGTWWWVTVNGRMWSATPRFPEAIERAHSIATYARRIRFKRDLARTTEAINRIENNR